ncbi:MAG: TrkH family potassium uptake protein, partial [Prevotellaceae bacterium]|nr:TrkH family potassium uptake protein [Prevotellaceae bacterium]
MINRRMIFRILGALLLIEAILMLCSAGVSLLYGENDMWAFLSAVGISLAVGLIFLWLGKHAVRTFGKRDGVLIVSVSWLCFSLFGMLPFLFSGAIPNLADAFFETMSGFTSTGATILNNIEQLPHGLLFWRSMTQWIGGLGIVFFTLAVLPIFGIGGVQLFAAEASNFSDKVHPRIGVTAKWIWGIYSGMTIVIAVLLRIGGMDNFDAVCHAFSTAGTGGYSTRQASISFYNSAYIEYVISIGMLVSGVNFTLLLLFVHRKFKKCFQDSELRCYLLSVCAFVAIITIGLYKTTSMSMELSFRRALFQVISLHTSTGFTTCDYMQ